MTIQSETHPGALVAPTDRDKIRREVIAQAWTAIRHATTADECRAIVAGLGNAVGGEG